MFHIAAGEPFTYKCGGEELAKVLSYYGLLPDDRSMSQKIVCPFHKDVNPSMIVDLEEGRFFCFGCGLSGDAARFVELMNPKLNELASMRKFFRILRSKKTEKVNLSGRIKKHRKPPQELYEMAWDYYHGLSPVDWPRDISEEASAVAAYMAKRGFTYKTLSECGAKVNYNSKYPIIFPIMDNGQFKGWVCRTTDREIEQKRKYLYNTGFSRRDTLAGDYSGCDYVFVVEGYMDRLKFAQYGVGNVVAVLGWKMTPEQEKKLKNAGVRYIISALDNDVYGRRGTDYLRTVFTNVIRFRYLKGVKDAGEMSCEQFNIMYSKTMQELIKLKRREKNGNFIKNSG